MLSTIQYRIEFVEGIPKNYPDFLSNYKTSIIFHSPEYLEYIKNQTQSKLFFGCLLNDQNQLIGVYPLFVKSDNKFGVVCNSGPYFGSHGGPMVIGKIQNREECLRLLQEKAISYCKNDLNCKVFTCISHPLDSDQALIIQEKFPTKYTSWRYGQLTTLPIKGGNVEEQVMTFLNYKKRNDIRKARKNGISCRVSSDLEDFKFLYEMQYKNMVSVGAKPKEESFFTEIIENFKPDQYKLYIAEKDGQKIGGILFFTNGSAYDYYCPAFNVEFRNFQPSALLIYNATVDAVKEGYQYLNWGGTAEMLTHIYDFKRKWGASDYKYHYFSYIFDEQILEENPKELAEAFPNYFLFPY